MIEIPIAFNLFRKRKRKKKKSIKTIYEMIYNIYPSINVYKYSPEIQYPFQRYHHQKRQYIAKLHENEDPSCLKCLACLIDSVVQFFFFDGKLSENKYHKNQIKK